MLDISSFELAVIEYVCIITWSREIDRRVSRTKITPLTLPLLSIAINIG